MSALLELEELVGRAATEAGPAVVGLGGGWGGGSGVVIAAGRVLTNAHNLRDGRTEVTVTFTDERRATGRVLGADADLDVAVIEVETGAVTPVAWAPYGDGDGDGPDRPLLGSAVLAFGNPGGRGLRVTPGFVSSGARSFRGPRGRRIAGAIEHTAPLPRGSSGGPLLDRELRLLGINTLRVEGGLILAIPADGATRARVEALGRGEAPERIRLGVAVAPPRVARRLRRAVGLPDRDGLLVRAVESGSAAERAGIEQGDLLVAAGEHALDRVDALYEAIDRARTGGRLELTIVRGTDERAVNADLA